jgi:hypothetical protein
MDTNIGVGLIIGLLAATTIYVYNSSKFNNAQKVVLYLCIIFPPAQWVLILIFLLFDYLKNQKSPEVKTQKESVKQRQSTDDKLQTLKDLHNKGILTDNEYYEKSAKLKTEKLQSDLKQTDEYKKLKSLYDDGILTKDEFDKKVNLIITAQQKDESSSIYGDWKLAEYNVNSLNKLPEDDIYININPNHKMTISNTYSKVIVTYLFNNKSLIIKNIDNPDFQFLNQDWDIDINNKILKANKRYFNKTIILKFKRL